MRPLTAASAAQVQAGQVTLMPSHAAWRVAAIRVRVPATLESGGALVQAGFNTVQMLLIVG